MPVDHEIHAAKMNEKSEYKNKFYSGPWCGLH